MSNLWNKLNRVLRGESYLHFLTMSFFLIILIKIFELINIYLPTWFIGLLTILGASSWEVLGNIFEKKSINYKDISFGLLGGVLVIILFRL